MTLDQALRIPYDKAEHFIYGALAALLALIALHIAAHFVPPARAGEHSAIGFRAGDLR